MKSLTDLIINGATKDEVLLNLNLLKMPQPAYPIWSINLVVNLNPQSMRANFELSHEDLKGMHQMANHVLGPNNESIPHLHEMLNIGIEGHLQM